MDSMNSDSEHALGRSSDYFKPGGLLETCIRAFEPRPQQEEMAALVDDALAKNRHLLVEAGTGVGKSLAYLIPSALWCAHDGKKAVIATHTKALQEQLLKKDLPLAAEVLSKDGIGFSYALLMGSENYLCARRLFKALKRGAGLYELPEQQDLPEKLLHWAASSETALRTEIPFAVPIEIWEDVRRESDLCMGRHCPHADTCGYQKDIARARAADLVVINHHLFFAGIPLKAFNTVIFDEAHNLEDTAARFLGFSLRDRGVKRLLDQIYNPSTRRGFFQRGGASAMKQEEAMGITQEVRSAAVQFFQQIFYAVNSGRLNFSDGGKTMRIKDPNFAEDCLSGPLTALAEFLGDEAASSQSAEEETELRALRMRTLETVEKIKKFLACDSRNHVYWVETSSSKRGAYTEINMAPLDVSQQLSKTLFDREFPVILTSATMAADGSFDMVKRRLGITHCKEAVLDSPFNFQEQVTIYTDNSVPDPQKEAQAYEAAVIRRCLELPEIIDGGTFILFTSWGLLNKVWRGIKDAFPYRPVLKQGEKTPTQLVREFKKAGNAILLGTDTFWQGIDIPGRALSCVIITRLPFMSPSSPLEEARHEWLTNRGENVFRDYTLPRAIIKFRQGFGRLIRTTTDYGAIVILDPRIRTRFYGPAFLYSIPKCGKADSTEQLREFFHGSRH